MVQFQRLTQCAIILLALLHAIDAKSQTSKQCKLCCNRFFLDVAKTNGDRVW